MFERNVLKPKGMDRISSEMSIIIRNQFNGSNRNMLKTQMRT